MLNWFLQLLVVACSLTSPDMVQLASFEHCLVGLAGLNNDFVRFQFWGWYQSFGLIKSRFLKMFQCSNAFYLLIISKYKCNCIRYSRTIILNTYKTRRTWLYDREITWSSSLDILDLPELNEFLKEVLKGNLKRLRFREIISKQKFVRYLLQVVSKLLKIMSACEKLQLFNLSFIPYKHNSYHVLITSRDILISIS